MLNSPRKVLAVTIYLAAIALLVLGALSFMRPPGFERGASTAIEAFKDVLLVAVGVRGGALIPSHEPVDSKQGEAPPEPGGE